MQRTMKVRKPINMQDLFKNRETRIHSFQDGAQRILVIGNPGTGKTCLSKRLCYDWAIGSWGTKFTHVYLLPIRRVVETSLGAYVDLPLIICQEICKMSGTQDFDKTMYEEIKDNLLEATTLLVLDGYDEAEKMETDLVSSAFTLNCSMLIVSRPHSIQAIRPRVDQEVGCLEFSNKQLESFLFKELGSKDGNDLLQFLNGNRFIKETCRVAVNAQIITRLWRSSYKEKLFNSPCANLSNFCSIISKYVWTRFREKDDRIDMSKTFDSLELVAFESFKEGMVEIPEGLIMDHTPYMQKIFRDSGFLLFMEEGIVFQFVHLTFHEYFAGCHLAKMLRSSRGVERRKAEKFIGQHKYIETSRVMLSFMTQCYCKRDDTEANLEAFKDLTQVLDSNPVPTISLQHLLLRMRTLDAFLPCALDEDEVHINDDVMLIVNDAMDVLNQWFGYELDGDDRGNRDLIKEKELQAPIIHELERMPNLFNRFPDLLKPVLLTNHAKSYYDDECRRDIARIGKLNPQYACQCIVPLLDKWTMEEQARMIQLCAFIGPVSAEPVLDHLKKLCEDRYHRTLDMDTKSLVKFLELFPKREDVRQLVVNASRDLDSYVRHILVDELGFITFTPEDEAATFVWDLLNEAMKDDDGEVRGKALRSCVRLYQTFAKSVDQVMEFIRDFMVSSDFNNDLSYASLAIKDLIQKAPEKEEELLALMKAICRDSGATTRSHAVESLLRIIRRSYLKREGIFNVAFDIFKDGYWDLQLELLPFLFNFDEKDEYGIDEVNELIANCQDLDEEVLKKASSCCEANALLSKYNVEELNDKFYDQDKKVQMEVVRQLDLREIKSNETTSVIVEMATHCLRYNEYFEPSKSLLGKFSKTELFPRVVLEKLAEIGYSSKEYVRDQPLSHLLKCYWSIKDANMIGYIIEKLLFSSVIFERIGETKMKVTFREKGADVKQTAPVKEVQELLFRCKILLKIWYGLDFL